MPNGRPPKFKTPEEMQVAIDAYFDACDPHVVTVDWVETDSKTKKQKISERKIMSHQQPYTMMGLAYSLGMSRRALLDYAKKGKFLLTVKRARERVEIYVESLMLSGQGVMAGVIFNAKNNFGYIDKTSQELSGPGGGPMEVKAALDRLDDDLGDWAKSTLPKDG
jgi:hypothetical protein